MLQKVSDPEKRAEIKRVMRGHDKFDGEWLIKQIMPSYMSPKEASMLLSDLGYSRIQYPAEYQSCGDLPDELPEAEERSLEEMARDLEGLKDQEWKDADKVLRQGVSSPQRALREGILGAMLRLESLHKGDKEARRNGLSRQQVAIRIMRGLQRAVTAQPCHRQAASNSRRRCPLRHEEGGSAICTLRWVSFSRYAIVS